jgi:hypothetical protein
MDHSWREGHDVKPLLPSMLRIPEGLLCFGLYPSQLAQQPSNPQVQASAGTDGQYMAANLYQ